MRLNVAPFLFVLPLIVAPAAPAQDEVLTLERRTSARAYDSAVALLKKTRMQFVASDMTPRDLCKALTMGAGGKLNFSCSRKVSEAAPTLELDLPPTSLWSIMSIAQMETGLRFVYRHGIVFLVPQDQVKPMTYLRVYDLRSATMPLRSFPGPDLRLRLPNEERVLFPEDEISETTLSGFTDESLETLFRETVRPESWEVEGVSLNVQNGIFLIRQTPAVHREIQKTLIKIGLWSPPRVRRIPARSDTLHAASRRYPALPPQRYRSFGAIRY